MNRDGILHLYPSLICAAPLEAQGSELYRILLCLKLSPLLPTDHLPRDAPLDLWSK